MPHVRWSASRLLLAAVSISLSLGVPMALSGCGGDGGGGRVSRGGGGGGTTGGGTTGGTTGGGGTLVAAATPIAVGTPLPGELFAWQGQYADREDGLYGLYAATLSSGTRYRITTSNSVNGGQDPYLYLMDRTGQVLSRDDNSGGALEAMIEYTPAATDTYVIALRAAARGSSGRCDLALTDASAPPLPGTPLAVGATLAGQVFEWQSAFQDRWEGTYGQFVVTLQAQGIYEIETTGPSGSYTDTFLYLMAPNGAILAEDDDSGAGNYSKITYTAPASGSFAVRLRAYGQGQSGTCSIALRQTGSAPPPQPRTPLAVGASLANQVFEWQSAYANREEGAYGEYSLSLLGGQTYTITTSNAVGGGGDTYLYLFDANLVLIDENDDMSSGNYHSRITYTPASDASFVVRLRAWSQGASGTCTISLATSGAVTGRPLYPDLRPLADRPSGYMYDAYYETTSAGARTLRFSNANFNGGEGDMALRMINNNGTMIAYQKITTDTLQTQERFAGQFVFASHASHNHYHFDHFNDYNLREVTASNGVGAIVATSNKVSFCLIDIDHYDPSLVGPTNNSYSCNDQGISVGWADVYHSGLDGQDIDIGGVPDGTYWLESVVDPQNLLLEVNDADNAVRIKVTINHGARSVVAP